MLARKGGDKMAAIDNAYNYYLTTYYGNRPSNRFDTHKKSELRGIYNSIVKINKESPLYKINKEASVARFAIDIKEGAQNIRNVAQSLSGSEDIMKAFQKKVAFSEDEDIVKARYIGSGEDDVSSDDFQIEVKQLAKPQINIGNFIESDKAELRPDSYAFDLTNTSSSYEFQFNVNEGETNLEVQKKLANLVTNAGVGLNASVIKDENGQSALQIKTQSTGNDNPNEQLFKIEAAETPNSGVAMKVLGIHQVSQLAQNAEFSLNGQEHSFNTNTFTIDKVFELTLNGVSQEDDATLVGFKANADAIADNIQTLVDSYNSVLQTAHNYTDSQPQSQKLINHITGAARDYRNELDIIGLNQDKNGFISIDRNLLSDVVESDNPKESFDVLNDFKNTLENRAVTAVLNPMAYVNKLLIAYKNPTVNHFATPYVTSIYSGMMMDRSC
jgi:flagellar hook-associated protein 2